MKKRCKSCGVIISEDQKNKFCENCETKEIKKISPFRSFFYIIDGFSLIVKNSKLLKLSLLPIILSSVILAIFIGIFFYLIISEFNNMLPSLISEEQKFLSVFLSYGVGLLGSLMMVIIFLFLFLPISTVICIPFNDSLAEETEKIILKKTPDNKFWQNFREEINYFAKEITKLLILKIVLILFALPLLFLPVIGQIIFFYSLALITALDFIDLIMSRKKFTTKEKLNFVKNNFVAYLSFGLPLLLFFWIPLLQLILIPSAVVGGTKFFLETEKFSESE